MTREDSQEDCLGLRLWGVVGSEKENLKLVYIIQVVQESPTQVMNIKISPRLSGRNKYKTLLGGYVHNPAFKGLSEKKTHPC